MLSSRQLTSAVDGRNYLVILTRVSARELDSDNLAGALKAVRDGVADVFFGGEDRETGGLEWLPRQKKQSKAAAGVLVEIFKKLDRPDQKAG